ncbi:MAG: leucyl aminopeptidase [Sphaerospermopsis sp. SIO1G2]|nr:leucyl aminopeptidase [Sphaerospermopsis sp. SIO1G2]
MDYSYADLSDYKTLIDESDGPTALALFVTQDRLLGDIGGELDELSAGLISKALAGVRFTGKAGQTLVIAAPHAVAVEYLFVVGLGAQKEITHLSYENAAGEAVKLANAQGIETLLLLLEKTLGKDLGTGEAEAHALYGARLANYDFNKYFTKKEAHELPSLDEVIVAGHKEGAEAFHDRLDALADGILFTRNLVSEPANIIHPESLAEICTDMGRFGLDVEVIGEKRMQKMGMHALLGVGLGSERESQLVVMRWHGAEDKKDAPVAFVGKGVCFDTGGISIKPSNGMEDMKWDMGGAATVIGLMRTLALRKAKVNAVGVVGLVENMPDGKAQRPGDVVTSYSGQTIEVLNTDAEGRLVLADALWYTQEQFSPRIMIDLATLTGAVIVALGSKYAGLMASDDALAEQLTALGKETGDETWRLPLDAFYDKQINSSIADMQNIGADREAGTITAGQFLQRFTNNIPWAHLDIAGTAWRKKPEATCPKGATGFGVRLLDTLVARHYES